MPVPGRSVTAPRWNASKIASRSSGATPPPLSSTPISTPPSLRLTQTSISVPGGVCFTAFEIRFSTTRSIFGPSTSATTDSARISIG